MEDEIARKILEELQALRKDISPLISLIVKAQEREKERAAISADVDEAMEVSDELFYKAKALALRKGSISTSILQSKFDIGYARAASLMDMLEAHGVIIKTPNGRSSSMLSTQALDTLQRLEKQLKKKRSRKSK